MLSPPLLPSCPPLGCWAGDKEFCPLIVLNFSALIRVLIPAQNPLSSLAPTQTPLQRGCPSCEHPHPNLPGPSVGSGCPCVTAVRAEGVLGVLGELAQHHDPSSMLGRIGAGRGRVLHRSAHMSAHAHTRKQACTCTCVSAHTGDVHTRATRVHVCAPPDRTGFTRVCVCMDAPAALVHACVAPPATCAHAHKTHACAQAPQACAHTCAGTAGGAGQLQGDGIQVWGCTTGSWAPVFGVLLGVGPGRVPSAAGAEGLGVCGCPWGWGVSPLAAGSTGGHRRNLQALRGCTAAAQPPGR